MTGVGVPSPPHLSPSGRLLRVWASLSKCAAFDVFTPLRQVNPKRGWAFSDRQCASVCKGVLAVLQKSRRRNRNMNPLGMGSESVPSVESVRGRSLCSPRMSDVPGRREFGSPRMIIGGTACGAAAAAAAAGVLRAWVSSQLACDAERRRLNKQTISLLRTCSIVLVKT